MLEKILSGKVIAHVFLKGACIAYGIYLGVRNYDTYEFLKEKFADDRDSIEYKVEILNQVVDISKQRQ